MSELDLILTRAGAGLSVRLEVYDDHNDRLHLSALAHPEPHHRRIQSVQAVYADN